MQHPRTTPSTPEKFENATPSLRVPFTLHENCSETLFEPGEHRVRVEGKRFENKALRKRCSRVNH